ncbi:serine/threonine-protein kinase [Streptomyces sp. C11-1]|uniref:Serine/threonine-protein kinase n=1 Tax=Streptomyces durocortorensis TaxID=2811104 RepID=A0ABY9W8A6_9ACTN|nr:serine/threonine-protein kinase [Streptomyces durocortorensis]WNF31090.1 serine/threonine-protein kinase [Streptomyces durocortorensis]
MGAPLEAEDPRQVGRYRIVARLGAGGMGRVYLGRSPGGRSVAVKVVHQELARDDGFRRRFAREVATARRVTGVFTAAVVDADPDGEPAWLATEYVPGPSLGEAVDTHGPWPGHGVQALGAGLAEALEAIHTADVIHRDLKPSNVLLAQDGPRVIDFGISVAAEATALTRTGTMVGTPGYMSPEQLSGSAPVGPASDVFSLGAVLTYAATGTGPFGTGPAQALNYRIVHEQPRLDGLPASLRDVVAHCLAKKAELRPDVGLLLDELGREAQADGYWLPDPVAEVLRSGRAPTASASASAPARPEAEESAAPRPPAEGEATLLSLHRAPTAASLPPPPVNPPTAPAERPGGAPTQPPARPAGQPTGPTRRRALFALSGIVVAGAGFGAWRLLDGQADGSPEARDRSAGSLGKDGGRETSASPQPDGTVRWTRKEYPVTGITARGRTLYVADAEGLSALDPANGRTRWSYATEELVVDSPRLGADDGLYAVSYDGTLHAVDTGTGRGRWTSGVGRGKERLSPVVPGYEVLYVSRSDGTLLAVSTADGSVRWTYSFAFEGFAPPARPEGPPGHGPRCDGAGRAPRSGQRDGSETVGIRRRIAHGDDPRGSGGPGLRVHHRRVVRPGRRDRPAHVEHQDTGGFGPRPAG